VSKKRKRPAGGGGALVLEITRKSPNRHIRRPGTIQALIYESMKELKRAEVSKLVDVVMASKDFRTRQANPSAQIKWYIWKFKNAGLFRQIPDRRYKSRAEVLPISGVKVLSG
jgi:hypothetical protein